MTYFVSGLKIFVGEEMIFPVSVFFISWCLCYRIQNLRNNNNYGLYFFLKITGHSWRTRTEGAEREKFRRFSRNIKICMYIKEKKRKKSFKKKKCQDIDWYTLKKTAQYKHIINIKYGTIKKYYDKRICQRPYNI